MARGSRGCKVGDWVACVPGDGKGIRDCWRQIRAHGPAASRQETCLWKKNGRGLAGNKLDWRWKRNGIRGKRI